MKRILLIEDEENVRKPLEEYLVKEGFQVTVAGTLRDGDRAVKERPDLVLMDWMLPDGQGIELLRKWRYEGERVPAIFLTARADLVDKVLGLELGANDYLTKPFEPRELVARIRVQLRGASSVQDARVEPAEKCVESSGFRMNLQSREVGFQGRTVEMTKTEYELLRVLLENPNQVFSRDELLKKVWGYDNYPTTRTVDTHILQLRQKFDAAFFETVHGVGYRFRPCKV